MTISSVLADPAAPRRRWAALLLVLATLALYLPGLASLPPMDRDEPRFAQASKQMLETGDFVDIRYQDEARNKKPVGIYWLQAGAVSLGQALGVADARRTIWLYRLPSLFGAILAVLGAYWVGLAVTTRRAAFLGALLFAATVILTVESHLAKTDAVLCATVVWAMGALLRIYLGSRDRGAPAVAPWLPAVFWTAIGLGILVKGPITPMVPAFTVVALVLRDRSGRWLCALRPGLGLAWVLLLVLPWLGLILVRTHGAFLADSVGHDMLGKVGGAQESHGAPPGTYLLAFWATAWPMAPFAALAAPGAWRRRGEPAVFFLLAWIVPTWLLFEIVTTKLPHYVMPTYPAVAILAALVLEAPGALRAPGKPGRVGAVVLAILFGLLPLGLAVVLAFGHGFLWDALSPGALVLGLLATVAAAALAGTAWVQVRRGAFAPAAMAAVGAAFVVNLFVLGFLLTPAASPLLAVSRHTALAGREATPAECAGMTYASVGDHEPSLVFLTGTSLQLTDAAGAARFLQGGDCRGAFVEARTEAAFRAALGDLAGVHLASRVAGTAINGGKHLDIGIYVRQRSQP
ncbi:glycosyltransferase family 39 protein [Lichenihabitans sp. Uapishka_5]|uniref:ArnT family glycosyltransferase n=1 Tax=Lichenihabitans sp. Uapishka_5 TaxID=3037302 RepID=UPI0029E7E1E2|nr:glycosyltransferase family 39 protein [Lichenihabitans sp. Uapishka_5]MDX7951624.1 glycosyltransferase family 39 protein [Lichenihabitans sp. Uapishka_5]